MEYRLELLSWAFSTWVFLLLAKEMGWALKLEVRTTLVSLSQILFSS